MAERICSVEGCDRKHFGKSFCQMHYQRWRTHGDPLLGAAVRNPDYCTVDGCDKPKHSRGWCPMHYQRWRIYGSLDPEFPPVKQRPRRVGIEPCEIDGCDKVQVARGWCVAHWTRWKRHGSPTARLRGEVVDGKRICPRCQTDKTLDQYRKNGAASLCKPCEADYQREYLKANPRPPLARNARECVCEVCGTAFIGSKKQYLRCSPECKVIGQNRANMKFVQARRAIERDPTAEKIPPRAIFERDGWTCALCGEAIHPSFKAPHPGTPSIDHLVPLGLGGTHTRTNVQAAHLGCNVRKGCRLVG